MSDSTKAETRKNTQEESMEEERKILSAETRSRKERVEKQIERENVDKERMKDEAGGIKKIEKSERREKKR